MKLSGKAVRYVGSAAAALLVLGIGLGAAAQSGRTPNFSISKQAALVFAWQHYKEVITRLAREEREARVQLMDRVEACGRDENCKAAVRNEIKNRLDKIAKERKEAEQRYKKDGSSHAK